ncbi:MAG: hypothetical protein HYX90_04300, partial [Chloroflexi bacterium]|nr:hypothetical protein [Chloroflexota bacterium]
MGRALGERKPAFYALSGGSWRDYLTLLHPPYTAWHLSYVVIGAALATAFRWDRFWLALAAFFLAVGVAAHALDELHGRPLRTGIPSPVLWALAAVSMAGAIAIGIYGTFVASPWLWIFIFFGAFIMAAYNLEWFRGRFHSDFWFALAWGAFPFAATYWSMSLSFGAGPLLVSAACFGLSFAQRKLSLQARMLRRKVAQASGAIEYYDGA